MIGTLAQQASQATPTPFHRLLKSLDDQGKLLRVYTQNIDCLEQQAGLTYGIPSWAGRRPSSPRKRKAPQSSGLSLGPPSSSSTAPSTPFLSPPTSRLNSVSPSCSPPLPDSDAASPSSTSAVETLTSSSASVEPSSVPAAPRCIPLHGHVKTLYCPRCSHTTPLEPYLSDLSRGSIVACTSCEGLESTRRLVGKRERGVGNLRPSVVLYGEAHPEGEIVGECVRRDLFGIQGRPWITVKDDPAVGSKAKGKRPMVSSKTGKQPDLLIVAGTSLKVPGTKTIVRQFSKSLKPAPQEEEEEDDSPTPGTPARRAEKSKVRSIFINLDFPVPTREWETIFDVWLQGDVQHFAASLEQELSRQHLASQAKQEKRLAKSLQSPLPSPSRQILAPTPSRLTPTAKRKHSGPGSNTPTKRRWLPSPTPSWNVSPRDLVDGQDTDIYIPPLPIPSPPIINAYSRRRSVTSAISPLLVSPSAVS